MARGTKASVRMEFTGDDDVAAMGNPGHVQQIAMNLVQNAVDALGDAPEARITLTTVPSTGLSMPP